MIIEDFVINKYKIWVLIVYHSNFCVLQICFNQKLGIFKIQRTNNRVRINNSFSFKSE